MPKPNNAAVRRKVAPGRGRPKDPRKRNAILQAATRLFTEQGLSGTSMEAVAELAQVSKITVYSHFSSKDELFRETVFTKCSQHWPEDLFDVGANTALRARLRAIAGGFLDLVFSKEVLNMYRLMIGQGRGSSRFGSLFWEYGPELSIQRFARILEAANRAGELQVPNPRLAASYFFVLLKGEYHVQSLLGAAMLPNAAARQIHIDDVIDMFLRAYARSSQP